MAEGEGQEESQTKAWGKCSHSIFVVLQLLFKGFLPLFYAQFILASKVFPILKRK